MSVKPETITTLRKAIKLELDNSKEYGERYSSNHEFYAVYKEELEELQEEMTVLETYSGALWDEVKHNQDLMHNLQILQAVALRVLSEASQVAAVIEKQIQGNK